MVWVAIYFSDERCHDLELRVVRADLDVEVLHVVRRALPPVLRMIRHVVRVADNGRLAVLRARRAVEVEAVEPHSGAVEHLTRMVLVEGLGGIR